MAGALRLKSLGGTEVWIWVARIFCRRSNHRKETRIQAARIILRAEKDPRHPNPRLYDCAG